MGILDQLQSKAGTMGSLGGSALAGNVNTSNGLGYTPGIVNAYNTRQAQPGGSTAAPTNSIFNQLQTRANGGVDPNAASTSPAPFTTTNYNPSVPAKAGGTGIDQASGLMRVQGSGIVPVGQEAAAQQGGFQTGGWQYGLGPQGNIQSSVPDTSGQYNTNAVNPANMPVSSVGASDPYMQKMQDAYMAQANRSLDPQWQQRSDQMASQLAAQGITPGSEAWNRQMSQFNLGRNDAYQTALNQGILNSGAEAARAQGMDVTAGNFANQAAQQNFQNQLTSQQAQNQALTDQMNAATAAGNFANQAQNQGFNQAMGQAQLNNAALAGQQQGALGKYSADQQLKGQQASASAAQAAASSQFAAAMAAQETQRQQNAMNASLQARQIQDQEGITSFQQAQSAAMFPIQLQNAAMQGMYPTQQNYPSYNQMGAAGVPSDYLGSMNQGSASMYGAAGSLGGTALQYGSNKGYY